YCTIPIHERNYKNTVQLKKLDKNIYKDPNLITLSDYKVISDKDYNEKLKNDNVEYKKMAAKLSKSQSVDYYDVYRVCERLIRANNLDYVNWRIAIRKTKDFNAYSSDANFVMIYTAVYDTLYPNMDALAFVIAHEFSHHILGHGQRHLELVRDMKYYKQFNGYYHYHKYMQCLKEIRMQEYMADAEAMVLLIRAGFDLNKAMEALNFLDALPNIRSLYNTHPVASDRIASIIQNANYYNPDWVYEGRENIYNSKVLKCKKSSDRVSMIISKNTKSKRFYRPETAEQKALRIGYISYLKGNMPVAAKYFEMNAKYTNRYVPYLYASYAHEYLYESSGKRKELKLPIKNIKKAYTLMRGDVNVQRQRNELMNIKSGQNKRFSM
ncbi:MAG: M48 family metallopeptidase, partial [Candidatus Gastranaerophilales bacterium]|nr:M48 family metallopeptidase [Candidatus Gastranaerophilales bacterium]